MNRTPGLLLLLVAGLIVFAGCGGSSASPPTLSARQVVAALKHHGVRGQITYGSGAPTAGVLGGLLNQFSGHPRPHVVAEVTAGPSRAEQTAACKGCVFAFLSDTVAHRQSTWKRWTNNEPEYLTKGGRKIVIARVFLVANVYLQAFRPTISRVSAAVRELSREAHPA